MSAYKLDVRPLLDEIGSDVRVADSLDIDELHVGEIVFEMVEPPAFEVTVSNAGEALVALGSISARVRTACVRCLRDFESTIAGDVDAMWARPGVSAADDEDAPPQIDADGSVDLEPALVSALVIEAPFAPHHAEDCLGLCPACGADLNVEACSCPTPADTEHPFASLHGLLDEPGEGVPGDE